MSGITENAADDIFSYIKEVNFAIYTVPIFVPEVSRKFARNLELMGKPFDLFLTQHDDQIFILKFSALEIYNEVASDLLNPESGPLRIMDDPEVKGKQSIFA
jgi:hypothetical protein